MKRTALLPLTLAVAAALSSPVTFAAEDNQINFNGYARYGAAYQGGDSVEVGTSGALNGNATGRLGNEGNGGEFQISKGFSGSNDSKWDVVVMFDHWNNSNWGSAGDVDLKKAYAGGSNLFESQPDMYVWAGRDFHQRAQTGLNDYFWLTHDGQGGGFKNMDLGGAKLNFAVVGQVESGDSGSQGDDNGKYAITSKLHGISLGDSSDLTLYANYGFASEEAKDEDYYETTAFQLGTEIKFSGQRLVVRYSDNAKDSAFDLVEGRTALLASFDGTASLSDQASIEYLAAYQKLEEADSSDDRANYNVILRPAYAWNDVVSTWVEAGYSVVDYDNTDATNSSWKVTLSQNISIGGNTWDRPMLRFYATFGDAENEVDNTTTDTVTLGAMWEAWW